MGETSTQPDDLTYFFTHDEIFHLSNDAVFIVDRKGLILKANQKATQIFGYELDEMINMPIVKLHPDSESEKSRDKFLETWHNHFARFFIGAVRKNGEKREVEISASRVEKYGKTFFISIVRDFTEQNEAQRKIDQLSQFPEQNPFPVIRANASYKLEYANNASKTLLEKLDLGIGDFLPQEWQDQVETICQNGNCQDNKPNFEFQLGEQHYLFSVSFIDHTNQVYLYGQDITELKRYQQELKTTNEELNTFIYKTHHDLKNPLSSLLGLVQLAETDIDDEDALYYMQMIHQSASKLDAILYSLIKAIEIKDGNKQKTDFAIRDLLAEVVERTKVFDNANQINLDYQVDESLNNLQNDRDALFYILENLLNNAIKYRDTDKNNHWGHVAVYPEEQQVVFEVSDNGLGIPVQYQDQIFTMFYRANQERKGTGLGLYIVKKGVKKLGGTIEVSSEESVGTTFYLRVPFSNY